MNFEKISEYLFELNNNQNLKEYYNGIINFEPGSFIPAVRYDAAIALNLFSRLKNPVNVLEIGFGSGASSLFINKNINPELFISLEKDSYRYNRGVKLLSNYKNNITLLNDDAFVYLEKSKVFFDFVFLDSVKSDYIKFINPIKKSLNHGGLLVTDNIIFSGRVVDDNVEKKYQNGVKYLNIYNKTLSDDNDFITLFVSTGDGLSISIKK